MSSSHVSSINESQGETYLLRLSHINCRPTFSGLRRITWSDLHRGNQRSRIEALELYFVTVLCQVNRGRVAKDRVLAFLRKEAFKYALRRNSSHASSFGSRRPSSPIGDKAACIATLREIHARLPSNRDAAHHEATSDPRGELNMRVHLPITTGGSSSSTVPGSTTGLLFCSRTGGSPTELTSADSWRGACRSVKRSPHFTIVVISDHRFSSRTT